MEKNRDGKLTQRQWIERIPAELEFDAVGLWQIIPVGRREFGLSGAELEKFTRRAIKAILDNGGIPVKGSERKWVREDKYGISEAEILQNILKNWLNKENRDPDVGDVWFARQDFI